MNDMTSVNHKIWLLLFFLSSILSGCGLGASSGERVLMVGDSIIDSLRLCQTIDSIVAADRDTTGADRAVRHLYDERHELCWLTLDGLIPQVDTLMAYISKAGETGMRRDLFYHDEIVSDRRLLDSLDFSTTDMYTVITRLDYNLTKAFVRYSAWQRYGLTNPYRIFNRLDYNPHDTLKTGDFRTLYDIQTEIIGKRGYRHLADIAGTDSVMTILAEAEPVSATYKALKVRLPQANGAERRRILVNMERCRWRHPSIHEHHDHYVMVNIPSYELTAVCPDSTLRMRIVCGSKDTKTPLLHSHLTRMDINPRWIMPRSVIKHEISHHAGDSAYFARHRYHIVDPKTGNHYNPRRVTAEMLREPGLRVYQEGGKGNALGRVIFRFDNNFSIFLHDTSSKGTFSRDDRRASHGCIRVQKPLELAMFLLTEKDDRLVEKLRYSMETTADTLDPKLTVHSISIKPQIPLFINYYTLLPSPTGSLLSYPDVYGYDDILAKYVLRYADDK